MNGPSGPEHRGNASGRKHIYIKKRAGRNAPCSLYCRNGSENKKDHRPRRGMAHWKHGLLCRKAQILLSRVYPIHGENAIPSEANLRLVG